MAVKRVPRQGKVVNQVKCSRSTHNLTRVNQEIVGIAEFLKGSSLKLGRFMQGYALIHLLGR
ncbi:hypothetical protein BDW74DRAFT_152178 [Aspergillus multicolor]|uniref:uncharacterized protein n=1 Tax=Aspergillus multicolor TaxID=41759 RepID=UPI003CCD849C